MATKATKAGQDSYEKIISDITVRRYAPVYILMGEEPYYLDDICDRLQTEVLPEEMRDFDSHIFYGADAEMDDILNTALQYPVMSDRKLVMLREGQAMVQIKSKLEKLENYFRRPSPTTLLVIQIKSEPAAASLKWMRAAKEGGAVIYTSQPVRDYNLPDILRTYCTRNKINIQQNAISMLCEYVGTNLQRLFGEVEKLRTAAGKNPDEPVSITADMVERNIGISKEYNVYEFTTALIHRDYVKSIRIADFYALNGKDGQLISAGAAIFNAFARLMIAHYTKGGDKALTTALKLSNRYALEEVKTGMRNYSAMSCMKIIHAVRDFDRRSKGIMSQQSSPALFSELIYRIFTL